MSDNKIQYSFESKEDFISKLREKYPNYNDIEDNDLYERILDKYPTYSEQIKPEPTFTEKVKKRLG